MAMLKDSAVHCSEKKNYISTLEIKCNNINDESPYVYKALAEIGLLNLVSL